ncbi:SAM-dependent methyltransferase [Actinophytocola gossypii]|uniref:SAM-dependent methyltransferase n=1 Tax=Actinophytocola gossypii TaxID=2812003 RepID=A0ABT2J4J6_9PSEU|nr:SAM-dependent methyltransferase [Actinophytocola gossypii]MCT2582514.1 SAM-dependent methyltransferase [Actinophytocola gossypii]
MSTERPGWAPDDVDLDRPNAARVYDYLLGGSANFAKDREFAGRLLEIAPDAAKLARGNRAFLRRAVNYCLRHGIRQFLDIGSGIPTVGNVHEITQRTEPSARVVYVDVEPVAVAHTELMLAGNENAGVVRGELLEADELLGSEPVRRLLNLDEPVAVLMVSVLHFLGGNEPYGAVARYVDAMASGSYLVISHIAAEDSEEQSQARNLYQKDAVPIVGRTRAELAGFFAGMELVEPGVVWTPEWHPEASDVVVEPQLSRGLVAVGRKP